MPPKGRLGRRRELRRFHERVVGSRQHAGERRQREKEQIIPRREDPDDAKRPPSPSACRKAVVASISFWRAPRTISSREEVAGLAKRKLMPPLLYDRSEDHTSELQSRVDVVC